MSVLSIAAAAEWESTLGGVSPTAQGWEEAMMRAEGRWGVGDKDDDSVVG